MKLFRRRSSHRAFVSALYAGLRAAEERAEQTEIVLGCLLKRVERLEADVTAMQTAPLDNETADVPFDELASSS